MQTFKKVLISSLAFIISFLIISIAIIEPLCLSEYTVYNDSKYRESISGKIDYLFVGASGGQCSFSPVIADKKMNISSFNLSNTLLTWYGRKILIDKEINRNPVKTVAIEISYNSLSRDYHEYFGDEILFCRLDNLGERIKFIGKMGINEIDKTFGFLMEEGISFDIMVAEQYIGKLFNHSDISIPVNVDYSNKGFTGKENKTGVPFHTSPEDRKKLCFSEKIDTNFNKRSLNDLRSIVKSCNEKNIEVIFVVVPISEQLIMCYDNWDDLSAKWKKLADELDCPLYDFNLLKNRYELFSDEKSFYDSNHMLKEGAELFTDKYCDVMNKVNNNEDVSCLFYDSYKKMQKDSSWLK